MYSNDQNFLSIQFEYKDEKKIQYMYALAKILNENCYTHPLVCKMFCTRSV